MEMDIENNISIDMFWFTLLYNIGNCAINNSATKNALTKNIESTINTDPLSKIFYGAWFLYIISLEYII